MLGEEGGGGGGGGQVIMFHTVQTYVKFRPFKELYLRSLKT